jgi:iron complex outermembrane receptor protein
MDAASTGPECSGAIETFETFSSRPFKCLVAAVFLAWGSIIATPPALAHQDDYSTDVLRDMTLEELTNVDISTASRKPEKLFGTAAAVYVITRDDILRSGATSIPEALRLAPGVEVARVGSHSWAVSVRGFNGDLSNKLLVLMDGRSVYSPLYAGVFWDVQDTLLEDVDRIEVVEGPGGTLWGANAVNGVINIFTRSAHETRGALLEAGAGNEEQGFGALRYGGQIGETGDGRAYIKAFQIDDSKRLDAGDATDRWEMTRGGFRTDWGAPDAADSLTIQGDIYDGKERGVFTDEFTLGTVPAGVFTDDTQVRGGNLLGRWNRQLAANSDITLQLYYDATTREIPSTFNERRHTIDLDFQHRLPLGTNNDILWGVGFRTTSDELHNTLFATFDPDDRTDNTYSAFVQDTIGLGSDRILLTLGSKFEHNDYTGYEVQPNVRLSWLVDSSQTLWAAVSRAVRIPSRLDADLHLTAPLSIPGIPFPLYIQVNGNDAFDSEKLLAYEAGYRIRFGDSVSFDLATFYNDYDKLQTTEPELPVLVLAPPLPYIALPNSLDNEMRGDTYGATLSANWNVLSNWRLHLQYSWFDMQLHITADSQNVTAENAAGNSPERQWAIRSFLDLPDNLSLYVDARYVDDLPNQDIPSYTAVDASIRWTTGNQLTVSLTGQNLFDDRHPEFGGGNEIERSVFGSATWNF